MSRELDSTMGDKFATEPQWVGALMWVESIAALSVCMCLCLFVCPFNCFVFGQTVRNSVYV